MSTKKLQIIGSLVNQSQNADTLDGLHASDFGSATDVAKLLELVGTELSVIDQIKQNAALKDHTHDNLQLYDTVSGAETITINTAVAQQPLAISLSSMTYTDLSTVTVVLNSENGEQSVTSNAEGVVDGLNAEEEFTLSLQSTMADFDPSQVAIECTYQLDLSKVLHDYVLHVDVDTEGGSGDININTGSVVIDETLSLSGAAADAKVAGDAIRALQSDKVSSERTINGKDLSEDIVLLASDVGAVPTTRKINGMELTEDINIEVETDVTLKVTGIAADAKATGDAIAAINTQIADIIADINYKEIEITQFYHEYGSPERGTEIKGLTLKWETNKEPKSVTVAGKVIDDPTQGSYTDPNATITTDTTWNIEVKDERDHTDSDTVGITFLNRVYYGAATIPEDVNNDFVTNLANKPLVSGRTRTFTVTANAGEYIWYCCPTRLAPNSLWCGGFEGGFDTRIGPMLIKNALEYSEPYYIYRSDNDGPHTLKVEVK